MRGIPNRGLQCYLEISKEQMEYFWKFLKLKSLYLLLIYECNKVKFKKEPPCIDLVDVFGKIDLKRLKRNNPRHS